MVVALLVEWGGKVGAAPEVVKAGEAPAVVGKEQEVMVAVQAEAAGMEEMEVREADQEEVGVAAERQWEREAVPKA